MFVYFQLIANFFPMSHLEASNVKLAQCKDFWNVNLEYFLKVGYLFTSSCLFTHLK